MSDLEESNKHQQEKTHSLGSNQPRVIKRPITTDEINIVKGGLAFLPKAERVVSGPPPLIKGSSLSHGKRSKNLTHTL